MKPSDLHLPKFFFTDDKGHRVLMQAPNIPLLGWVLFKIISLLLEKGVLQTGAERLSTAFIFTWALLEFTQGVNYFRRLLGLVFLTAVVTGFFRT